MKTKNYLLFCLALSVVWVASLVFMPAFANAVEGFIHEFLAANSS